MRLLCGLIIALLVLVSCDTGLTSHVDNDNYLDSIPVFDQNQANANLQVSTVNESEDYVFCVLASAT